MSLHPRLNSRKQLRSKVISIYALKPVRIGLILSLVVVSFAWAASTMQRVSLQNVVASVSVAATSSFASIELESSTVSNGAAIVTNAAASGGKMIQFGTGTVTPSPTPTPPPSAGAGVSRASIGGPAGLLPGVGRTTIPGDYVITTDGQTVSNLTITGDLYISANNVTVNNVQTRGIHFNQRPGGNYNVVVKDRMTVSHADASSVTSIGGNHITVTDSHIGVGNAGTAMQLSSNIQPDGTVMPCDNFDFERNIIDGLVSIPANSGVHSEAIHLMGMRYITIRDNYLHWVAPDHGTWSQITAVINLQSYNNIQILNATVDHNDFSGGSYFFTYLGGNNSIFTNNALHNVYDTSYNKASAVYPLNPGETLTRSGNTLDGVAID